MMPGHEGALATPVRIAELSRTATRASTWAAALIVPAARRQVARGLPLRFRQRPGSLRVNLPLRR